MCMHSHHAKLFLKAILRRRLLDHGAHPSGFSRGRRLPLAHSHEMLWNWIWNWTKPGLYMAKKRPQFLDFICGNSSHPSPGGRTFGCSSFGRSVWTFRKRNATVRGSFCRSPVELLVRCTVRCSRFTLALMNNALKCSSQANGIWTRMIELLSGKFKRTLW